MSAKYIQRRYGVQSEASSRSSSRQASRASSQVRQFETSTQSNEPSRSSTPFSIMNVSSAASSTDLRNNYCCADNYR